MITIWKTGDVEYPDVKEIKDKPVRYDINDLIEIASRTSTIDVTDEHNKDVVAQMSNFIVENGLLKAEEPNNLDLSGMGFSPVFEYDLIDMGDYYKPKNIVMTEIGYTKTPRSHIVYNSITVPNSEDNNMEDKQLRDALDTNKKLNEEIGELKSQIAQLKKANTKKDEEIQQIKDSYSDTDAKLKEYDSLKEIESQYNSMISSQKDDLIYKIAGDNEELKNEIKDYSIKQLETSLKLMSGDKPPKGETPLTNHTDDGGDPLPEEDDTPNEEEAIKFYEETFGEKPSFVKE